jgi:acetyltransferase-like isoleucine patch superfamily enzyme
MPGVRIGNNALIHPHVNLTNDVAVDTIVHSSSPSR